MSKLEIIKEVILENRTVTISTRGAFYDSSFPALFFMGKLSFFYA